MTDLDALIREAQAIDQQVAAANQPPPEPEPEPPPEPPKPTDEIRGLAAMVVDGSAKVAIMRWPCLAESYPQSVKQPVADKLAAVLAKYGIGSPTWLAQYQQEFELGMLLAGIAYASYRTIQAAAAAEQAERESINESSRQEPPAYDPQARYAEPDLSQAA